MDWKNAKNPLTYTVRFEGFTNSTFNRAYFSHNHNSSANHVQGIVPAEIFVKCPDLRKALKELGKGAKVNIQLTYDEEVGQIILKSVHKDG